MGEQDHSQDVLIVAGDVSHSRVVLRRTLAFLAGAFKLVFFVPGNHDLWLDRQAADERAMTSLDKMSALFELCAELGVETGPRELDGGVVVLPLLSWHHASFDTEPDITHIDLAPVHKVCVQ